MDGGVISISAASVAQQRCQCGVPTALSSTHCHRPLANPAPLLASTSLMSPPKAQSSKLKAQSYGHGHGHAVGAVLGEHAPPARSTITAHSQHLLSLLRALAMTPSPLPSLHTPARRSQRRGAPCWQWCTDYLRTPLRGVRGDMEVAPWQGRCCGMGLTMTQPTKMGECECVGGE